MKTSHKLSDSSSIDKKHPSWLIELMSERPDRLRLLKTRYLSQINKMESDLKHLREKVRFIDELESDSQSLLPNTTGVEGLKYANWDQGVTKAVLDVIDSIATTEGVTSATIAKQLLENGFVPKGKNFNITLNTTLKRLAESKRINSEKSAGRRLYWASEYR